MRTTGIEAVIRLLQRQGLQACRGVDANRLIVQSNATGELGEIYKAAELWWFRASSEGEWIVKTEEEQLVDTATEALHGLHSPIDSSKQTA